MTDNNKIAFIGPGVMAEAMIAGLIRQNVAEPSRLIASGPRIGRGEELSSKYGIETLTENAEAAGKADVIVLSVKPQRLDVVLSGMRGAVKSDALVLSIVAPPFTADISLLPRAARITLLRISFLLNFCDFIVFPPFFHEAIKL